MRRNEFPGHGNSGQWGGSGSADRADSLRRVFNRAAVLVISLVVAVAMGLLGTMAVPEAVAAPNNPGGDAVENEYLGCATFDSPTEVPAADEATTVRLRIEGSQRGNDSNEYTQFVASNYNAPGTTIDLNDPNAKIENVANNRSMVVDINVEMTKPSQIDGVTLVDGKIPHDWIYPLPFDYSEINESSKTIVTDPSGSSEPHAWMQVVKGCGDDNKAYLRVNYNTDWLNGDPDRLGFTFAANITISDDKQQTQGGQKWEFPGVDNDITITWTDVRVPGSKNCFPSDGRYKCEVTVKAEKDVKNFKFYDKSTGMVIDTSTIRWDDQTVSGLTGSGSENGRDYDFSFTLDELKEGDHKLTYEFDKQDSAQWDGNSYNGTFENHAWWTWGDEGQDKADWVPTYELNTGGGGGGGEQDHRTNIFKQVENQNGENGNVTAIKWTIGVNSDRKHELKNFTVTDTLTGRHNYDFANHPLVVEVKNDNGNWEPYTTMGESDPKGEFSHTDGSNTFSYTFPDDAEKCEYQLVYYTVPQTNANGKPLDMSVSNGASVCDPNDCDATNGDTSTSTTIRETPETRVTKSNVQSHGWNEADGEIERIGDNNSHMLVPWSLVFDPSEELAMHKDDPNWRITHLELKEDWVNANSDGNTLHMWYSRDTIDLKVYMQDANGDWEAVPTSDYRVYANLDGNRELPETGTDFPTDWYENNDGKNGDGSTDNYTLHKGVPRFKLRFEGDKAITGPVKITYNTIFDRTPDSYVNYAQFRFDANGKSYDTPNVSSEYVHGNEYQVGKATDVDHYGKDYWDNNATITQCSNIGVDDADTDAECFKTDWTVWANGPKPWGQPDADVGDTDYWKSGISGAVNMTGAKVTFTDTLPKGWKVLPGSLKAILMLPNYDKDGKISIHDIDAGISSDSYSYSYDESANKFTVSIDNMSNIELDAGSCSVDGTSVDCPTQVDLEHAMIKFVYSTYLPYAVAEADGYQRGEMLTVQNHAEVTVGDHGAGATGETVIYKPEKNEGVLDKELYHGMDSTNTNRLDYKIVINKDCNEYNANYTGANLFPGNASTITLSDVLSPLGQYVPDSLRVKFIFSNGGGVDKPSVTYKDLNGNVQTNSNTEKWHLVRQDGTSDDDSAFMPVGWTKRVTRDPETGSQQFELTIPKNLQVVNTEDGPWNSAENRREPLYGTLVFNEHVGIEATYQVSVNGLPGQTLEGFSNSAKLRADANYDDETSNTVVVPSITGSVWQAVTPVLKKIDSNTANGLPGAQFSLKQVDVSEFYNADGTLKDAAGIEAAAALLASRINDGYALNTTSVAWDGPFTENGEQYLQSGNDGTTRLPSLSDHANELFVMQELRAPNNYERSTKSYYLVATDTSGETNLKKSEELIAIVNAINAQIRLAKNKIVPLYRDANNNIFVSNDRITDFVWGKVDSESGVLEESGNMGDRPTYIQGPMYLRGSSWMISTSNPTDAEAEPVCADENTSDGGLLPCTVYVTDNRSGEGESDGKWYVPDTDGSDGMLKVEHLKPGAQYSLQEMKAPEGYKLSGTVYRFTIDAEGNVTWIGDARPWEVKDNGGVPTGVHVVGNEPEMKVVLPVTGGDTSTRIVLMGLALVVAALMFGMWYVNVDDRRMACERCGGRGRK